MLRRTAIAAACTACAGCGWMFPDDRDVPDAVREQFAGMAEMPIGAPGQDCEILVDRTRLVATEADGGAAPMKWFLAPTSDGGYWETTARVNEDGELVGGGGGGGGCGPIPGRDEDDLWWSGGIGSDSEVVHGGHAPAGSERVRLYFGDHEPVLIDVEDDGYFLVVLDESACCEWSYPDSIEALDADGEVMASVNP